MVNTPEHRSYLMEIIFLMLKYYYYGYPLNFNLTVLQKTFIKTGKNSQTQLHFY